MSDQDKQSNTHYNAISYQEEEITLKELLLKTREYFIELWRKKWWIILAALPFALYFGYKAKNTDTIYTAQLTYMLNDGSGGTNALGGLLGSFGLGKGGKVNLDKIVALSKSRNIINKILLTEIPLDTFSGKNDLIANHLIALYKLDEKWSSKTKDWKGFTFKSKEVQNFSSDELMAIKMLYGQMVGGKKNKNALFSNNFNEDTGIMTITSSTVVEELSIEIAVIAYNYLKNYYIENTTKGSQNTFSFVQAKTDSIFNLLKTKQYQLAAFNDSHRNLTEPGLLTKRKLIETEILKLTTMYAEVTKNRELADFSLTTGTPDLIIIDEPYPPLDGKAPSLIIEILKGVILGILLAVSFITGRKIVLDALQS